MIAVQSTILRDLQSTMDMEKMDKLLAFRGVQWCGNTKVYHNHMTNQQSFENEVMNALRVLKYEEKLARCRCGWCIVGVWGVWYSRVETHNLKKKKIYLSYKRRFFIFWAIDICGRAILCCGRLSCVFSSMPNLHPLVISTNTCH